MKISYKNGRGNKIHLFIDDEYQITTTSDFLNDNFFQNNIEITEDEWIELVEKINYSKAVGKCYDLLSRRMHSVKELRDKLLKSFDRETADKAIDLMLDYGYLNDEEYANDLFSHLTNDKRMSERFIILEMNKRGISSDIIQNLVYNANIDNVGTAFDIITSKYLTKLNQEGGRQKVIAAMSRKGFSYSDIASALDKIQDYDEF
ncbi:MAG: regulatory protein RecX [Ruminococcaceae bacterium]|nr:regulatory protein RecX [Oscillospiraceae bacterium]